MGEALRLKREVYDGLKALHGQNNEDCIIAASNISVGLTTHGLFAEAKQFSRKALGVARRALEDNHLQVLMATINYARALFLNPAAPRGDVLEAEKLLLDALARARRLSGPQHPRTLFVSDQLEEVRQLLAQP